MTPRPQVTVRRLSPLHSGGLAAAVLLVASLLGFGPPATLPANADAGYCNIYPPGRIALWGPATTLTVRFGEGCARSGADGLWSADITTTAGKDVLASWHRGDPFSRTYQVSDRTRLAEVQWGAYRPVYGETPQHNEPWTTVKLGAVSYVSVSRSGGYHVVLARGYHYSPTAGRIVPSGNREGQLQYRTSGTAVWRPVTGIRLAANGRATVRTWSPGARDYRVSFGEQPTLFGTVSTAVRAR